MTIRIESSAALLDVDAGPLNITGRAASTWQTVAGVLTLDGAAGINMSSSVTISGGANSLLVTAVGGHRFTGGTLEVAVATDWSTAANITASGNPIWNFGTGACLFGGRLTIGGETLITDALLHEVSVEAHVAADTLTAAESGRVFTNTGAVGIPAARALTLPDPAVAGMHYTFYNQNVNGLQIIAGAAATIRVGGRVSGVGGTCTSNATGSAVHLIAISATEWIADSVVGAWTLV
jgi:hypothetical protein